VRPGDIRKGPVVVFYIQPTVHLEAQVARLSINLSYTIRNVTRQHIHDALTLHRGGVLNRISRGADFTGQHIRRDRQIFIRIH
jgi:hypothetical protein